MQNIVIQGKLVTLRTRRPEDTPVLYELIYGTDNPMWKQYDAPYFPLKHVSYEVFETQWSSDFESGRFPSDLLIEVQGQTIGLVTFYWEHEPSKWLEAGITIYDPQHWSGGYGTEALSLWVDCLFRHLDIARVGITTWSGNPRMMRCAEKIGMRLEGRMRKCRYYNGVYYDSIRMGVLREEWEERKASSNPSCIGHSVK
ncbi:MULTISPECIES: GNAT family protein [Paenibacillus]|jgi:RimJ/RimL family protein N-acetyltransferase|uniref:GCN5-related N-acetyltransferase n=2 Tax=Paenibacillus lactis TaxID=228574 RepID=G4H7Q2_9BACL|nr:GNAT family protein [Paenibacillus lactis]EHB67887.1 GCN5-related N-acetyltransferase [Paenibacillus lactis 154]MBP1892364.1 RimJ/RimL family protein N-acetyltransferase [Paenibacillus lactis]MCM3493107.1 GNAT family N-acetyltransferase [Paenibacillus lactis]GIO89813.1 acetyltransferase [Paenibacillus lactis]HAG01305.1 N-acetyltransferase [Paenibacillus lactis]